MHIHIYSMHFLKRIRRRKNFSVEGQEEEGGGGEGYIGDGWVGGLRLSETVFQVPTLFYT